MPAARARCNGGTHLGAPLIENDLHIKDLPELLQVERAESERLQSSRATSTGHILVSLSAIVPPATHSPSRTYKGHFKANEPPVLQILMRDGRGEGRETRAESPAANQGRNLTEQQKGGDIVGQGKDGGKALG